MAEISKQALKVDNNQSFPNNNNGAITPSILRAFNTNMIDSMVDEISYNVDSASWNSSISQLNVFTASAAGLSTGSLLVTASAVSNVITFTKGNGTTFNVTVADTTDLGPLNQFTASAQVSLNNLNLWTSSYQPVITNLQTSQSIDNTKWNTLGGQTGSYATSVITASSLITASVNLNTITFTKGDASTFNITVNTGSGGGGGTTDITSLNAFTASQETKDTTLASVTSSLNSATASLFASASLALVTASAAGSTITFTKGDSTTFNVTLDTGSATSSPTIFEVVYTGENITKGDPLYISGSQGANPRVFIADAADPNKMPVTFVSNETIGVNNTTNAIILGLIEGIDLTGYVAGQTIYVAEGGGYSTSLPSGSNSITQLLGVITKGGSGGKGLVLNPGPAQLPGLDTGKIWVGGSTNQPVEITTASFATTGSNNFKGVQSIGSQAGTATGEVYLLGHSGSLVLGASTSTPTYAALTFITSSQQNQSNLIFKLAGSNGSTLISGSNNIFTTPAAASAGRIYYMENNNIFLNDSGFLPTISSSAYVAGAALPRLRSNMWLGTGPWTINTNSGITSFSTNTFANNLFLGSSGTTLNLINTTGQIAFSHNLAVQGGAIINAASASGATVATGASGSNSLTMANNFMLGGFITYNGPISSSLHTITGNSVQGTVTFNLQSGSKQYTVNQNIVNGTLTLNDNIVFSPTLGSTNTFTGNNINGTTTINNRASASLAISANNINSWNINNDFDASSVASAFNRSLTISGNALFGALQNNLYASGAVGAVSQSKAFSNNLFAGQFLSASIVANGTEGNMYGTIGAGNDLHIAGTSRRDASSANGAGATIGSAFFGRYNKVGQGFNTTAETIFAVGTGTSGSTGVVRKTGFLIDSGSNTFIEGTLNVSGSTTITGSLILSSSNAIELQVIGNSVFTGSVNGNVVSMSINSNTASMDFNLGNYFELSASVSPIRIELTNVTGGTTKTLSMNGVTSSTIVWSSNVLQPSGSAYTASVSGSNDILSFVSFNSSLVNVVSTLKMI